MLKNMNQVGKIIKYLQNKDVRKFLGYSVFHPQTIKERFSEQGNMYFTQIADSIDYGECKKKAQLRSIPLPLSKNDKRNILNRQYSIHLAGTDIDLDMNRIDWSKSFDDFEDETSLHRFVWLYRFVLENINNSNKEEIGFLVRTILNSWIDFKDNSLEKGKYTVWQTYTVVERLISWSIILSLTTNNEEDQRIIDSMTEQLDYIKEHLEYHGTLLTGCHFLNDGRGLYIVGKLLNIDEYAFLGKTIINEEFKKSISDKYYFIEGSVHYHFLMTKWFCDLYWIANVCKDFDFLRDLRDELSALLVGAKAFLVKDLYRNWHIPFIGDISPDYQPEWIIGVPWVGEYFLNGVVYPNMPIHDGYHTFFLDGLNSTTGNEITEIHMMPSKDWGKISNSIFTVFSHSNNAQYPNNAKGHLHYDSGTLSVYCKGEELLVDCGRSRYTGEEVSELQKGCRGHNAIVIDDKEPDLETRIFYTRPFIDYYLGAPPILKEDNGIISIEVDGGRRLNYVTKRRVVELDNNEMRIKDEIAGKGIHELSLYFHLPKEYSTEISAQKVIAKSTQVFIEMDFSEKPDTLISFEGIRALEYGDYSNISVIAYKKHTKLPCTIVTTIRYKEEN